MSDLTILKKKVCLEIRSYLMYDIAKGLPLTVLNKRYKEDTGNNIPFKELGFASLLVFLQSIPDVVQIRHGLAEPQIFLVPDEKTRHIEKLAAITQSNSKKRMKRGRYSRQYNTSNYSSQRSYYSSQPSNYSSQPSNYSSQPSNYSSQPSNYSSQPSNYSSQPSNYNSKPSNYNRQTEFVPQNTMEKIEALLKKFGITGIPIKNLQSHYKMKNEVSINFSYFGFSSLEKCLSSIPHIATLKRDNIGNVVCVSTKEIEKAREINLKSVVPNTPKPLVIPSMNVPLNEGVIKQQYVEDSEEEGVYDKLKNKMRKVLKDHPNGLRIETFLDEFEKTNNEVLNLEDIGYNDITELVKHNQTIFGIIYPSDSEQREIIYDAHSEMPNYTIHYQNKTLEIPKEVISSIKSILESHPRGLALQEFEEIYKLNCKCELPWLDFGTKEKFYLNLSKCMELVLTLQHGEMYLKLDCQDLTFISPSERKHVSSIMPNVPIIQEAATCEDKYMQQTIPTHKGLDDYIGIVVSEVLSPGCFFIQLLGLQYIGALEQLMNHLKIFYQNYSTSKKYKISQSEFEVHLPCAALYGNDWHRAIIVDLLPPKQSVEVFYVDYGTTDKVLVTDVQFLPKMFMELPSQAIKCRLGLVEPSNLNRWTSTSATCFLNLIKDKDLRCRFLNTSGFDYKKGLEVVLNGTHGEDDIRINDIMIAEGHARKCEDEFLNFRKVAPDSVKVGSMIQKSCQMTKNTKMVAESASKVIEISDKAKPFSGKLYGALLEAKRRMAERACKPKDINIFDNSIFSKIPSKPCPNQSLSPLPKYTSNIFNSLRDETKKNIFEPGNTSTQAPKSVFDTIPQSSNDDISVTSTKPLQLKLNFSEAALVNQNTFAKDNDCQKRFTKFLTFSSGYSGDLINYKKKPFLTSFDLSHFLFASNDLILKMFRRLKIKVTTIVVEEEECPDLFAELNEVRARGFEFSQEKHLTLFPLLSCIEASRVFLNKELEKALQQCLENFDPEDFYWLENVDDYSNLNLESLQEKIDSLTTERKYVLSVLQNSDPGNFEHHLAYNDLMNDLIYAMNIKKILIEEKFQADTATGISIINAPKQTTNALPLLSTQTSLAMSNGNATQMTQANNIHFPDQRKN